MKINEYSLYDYVFHYNGHNKMWAAIPRELYTDYWADYNKSGILRSKSIKTLITILHKTGGDKNKISKLVGEK